MVYYQKLFRRCLTLNWGWGGGGGGRGAAETKFVLSMFNKFVILAGMQVSRVLSKIVANWNKAPW